MKIRLFGAICASLIAVVSQTALAVPVSGQGTWESTLQGRDLDGNPSTFEAYYDTTLNITWLADANAAGTPMTWSDANTWVAGLDVNGITGWRLPTNTPVNGGTYDTTFSNNATTDWGTATTTTDGTDGGWRDASGKPVSEIGHMFYVTLGNRGFCTQDNANPSNCTQQTGWGLSNTGPFSRVQENQYWSGSLLDSSTPWRFGFTLGDQDTADLTASQLTWAVRFGDVGSSVVPVPAAAWLFGSGLLSLIGIAGRKKA